MNVFIFDIETVPDVEGARRLWSLDGLDDKSVADVMYNKRSQETGGASDFHRHHLHKVVAISVVLRSGDKLNVWSLGDESSSEAELIRRLESFLRDSEHAHFQEFADAWGESRLS